MNNGVSVIICCYNSAPRLRETLKHLSLQDLSGISAEIIVVDNASTDNTKETALQLWNEFGAQHFPLRIISQPVPGLSHARAKGIETAAYDVFLFCDDDNWLDPQYVRQAYFILKNNPEVGAIGGLGTAVSDVSLPMWFEAYKGCFACYPQADSEGKLTGDYAFLYGAGLVTTRQALTKLSDRGFIPILPDRMGTKLTSGGDTELSYALRLAGYSLWYSPRLTFKHYMPESRLTEEYLFRLVSALSYCSGRLFIYNYILSGKEVHATTWIKDALYQMRFLVKAVAKYLFGGEPAFQKRLDLTFSVNRTKSVLQQIGQYASLYRRILKLKGEQ